MPNLTMFTLSVHLINGEKLDIKTSHILSFNNCLSYISFTIRYNFTVYTYPCYFSWRRAQLPTPIFLPGESPWTEEPGRLQSMGSQRVRHNLVTKHTAQVTLEGEKI